MRSTGLRKFRTALGKNQEQMAGEIGVLGSHYNMMEKGKRGISSDIIKKISVLTGEPMESIYEHLKVHEVTTKDKPKPTGTEGPS